MYALRQPLFCLVFWQLPNIFNEMEQDMEDLDCSSSWPICQPGKVGGNYIPSGTSHCVVTPWVRAEWYKQISGSRYEKLCSIGPCLKKKSYSLGSTRQTFWNHSSYKIEIRRKQRMIYCSGPQQLIIFPMRPQLPSCALFSSSYSSVQHLSSDLFP